MTRKRLSRSLVLLVLLAEATGHAQSAEDKAAAEALFDEARMLMQQQKYALACPKLVESNRLDAGLGTVLWLGDCYEKNGQSASAWAEFREAEDIAAKNHDPRERVAKERADRLQPMLSKMTILVPHEQSAPGLVVKRDADDVGKSQWGVAVPVDPGPHKLVVTAPRKQPWERSVFVPAGVNVDVPVPALSDAPAAAVAIGRAGEGARGKHAEPSSGSGGGGQRAIGGVLMGLGLAGVGAGTLLAVLANVSLANSTDTCGGKCASEAAQDAVQGHNETVGAAVSFAAGGGLLVTGLVVILTAPSGSARNSSVSLSPWITREAYGGAVGVAF
jgi:hypothetical protein